jgi:hypothetical protein
MSWIIETGNNLKTKGQVRDRKKNKIIYIYITFPESHLFV